jgi:hypothetical protein
MLGSWDSFWDSLEHAAEDLICAIEQAVISISEVVVDVAKGVIQFTATLGKDISSAVLELTIDTIHAVEAGLIVAFNWIVSTFQKVIDWLKEIFNWGNIIHVHDVIEAYIKQFLTNATNSVSGENLTTLQNSVQKGVNWLNTNISDFFNQARSLTGSVESQPALQAPTPVGSSALTQENSTQQYSANQVKSNTAQTGTGTYVKQGGTFGPASNTSLTRSPLAEGDFISQLETLSAASSRRWSISSPPTSLPSTPADCSAIPWRS